MWDFILQTGEEAQAMPITTRSKNFPDMSITNQKHKTTLVKEKTVSKKSKTSKKWSNKHELCVNV